MSRLAFDLETNGLLPEVDRIHCIVARDLDTGAVYRFNDQGTGASISAGLKLLSCAELLVGHNIKGYDLPVINKLYPEWSTKAVIRDTLVLSQLIYTNLKELDFNYVRKNKSFPLHLIGRHSLEAWGYRLCNHKDDYSDGWEVWSIEMEDYCVQDVSTTVTLWEKICSKNYSPEAIELEHAVKRIILRQTAYGFKFDVEAANRLHIKLQNRSNELNDELIKMFKPWYVNYGRFTPKLDNRKHGYVGGCALTKVKLTTFNPGSRDHIANRLMKLYGWRPTAFGKDGKPTVDEDVLQVLNTFPGVKLIIEYLVVAKRLGQVAEGKQAWLKVVKDGRIHGSVNTNGAVTGRMTHNSPNVAQTPSGKSLYGPECRALFVAGNGNKLTGADAEGLELRCLAHYMARWDAGAYADIVLNGDIHTVNQTAAGLPTRDDAKTFIYAFLYGAGDEKIGAQTGRSKAGGRALKKQFLAGLPALGALIAAVQHAAKNKGFLRGIDGREIHVRSPHAALNTLLQGAGAVAMKKALVILDDKLQLLGLVPGVDYEFVGNIHDEWQIEHKQEHTDVISKQAPLAITSAGEHFSFRCRLDGKAKTGINWAETH